MTTDLHHRMRVAAQAMATASQQREIHPLTGSAARETNVPVLLHAVDAGKGMRWDSGAGMRCLRRHVPDRIGRRRSEAGL